MSKLDSPAILCFLLILSSSGCRLVETQPSSTSTSNIAALTISNPSLPSVSEVTPTPPPEQAIVPIPINGPLATPEAEVSGMAWYGEYLILLPQFPSRFAQPGSDGSIYALPKAEIIAFLDGSQTAPLNPIAIPFVAPGLADLIYGFEGFEAITISGERAYFTIESHSGAPMVALLTTARISPDLSLVKLDTSTLVVLSPQTLLPNYSDEAMFVSGEEAITIYEANGKSINANPVAHRLDLATFSLETIPFPNLEYRITDATDIDSAGRFWVINTFSPKDSWMAADTDPIVEKFDEEVSGEATSHFKSGTVERLVELQYTPAGITLTDTPPVQLKLIEGESLRNWEALARLDERGFLLMTDKHPRSILAFVPIP